MPADRRREATQPDPRHGLLDGFLDHLVAPAPARPGHTAQLPRATSKCLFALNAGRGRSRRMQTPAHPPHCGATARARACRADHRAYAVGLARLFSLARAPSRLYRTIPASACARPRARRRCPRRCRPTQARSSWSAGRRARSTCATRRCSSSSIPRGCGWPNWSASISARPRDRMRDGEVTVTGKGGKTRTVPVGSKARAARAPPGSPRAPARAARSEPRCSSERAAGASPRAGAPRACAAGRCARAGAARAPAHAAALLRHACAAVLGRPARGAGDARALEHLDDAGVHAPGFPAPREGLRRRASAGETEV